MDEVNQFMAANMYVMVLLAIIVGMAFLAFMIFRAKDNEISCWQLISSRGLDGRHYADIDKVGKVLLLLFFLSREIYLTYLGKLDFTELLLFVTYASGIAVFSAIMRSKAGLPPENPVPPQIVTTTTTTETEVK